MPIISSSCEDNKSAAGEFCLVPAEIPVRGVHAKESLLEILMQFLTNPGGMELNPLPLSFR